MKILATRLLLHGTLRALALQFTLRPGLRRELRGRDGWIDFTVGFRPEPGSVAAAAAFSGGRVHVSRRLPESPRPDTTLVFADEGRVGEMLRSTPHEVMGLLLSNHLRVEGSLTWVSLFSYLLSRLVGPIQDRVGRRHAQPALPAASGPTGSRPDARVPRLRATTIDPGVLYLDDPYLPDWTFADFPRLARFLDAHFTTRPEVCAERALLVTQWHRRHGFEVDGDGRPWAPELRQGRVLEYVLSRRAPIVHRDDLIAGTTTAKEVGVVLYPDAHGTLIWGELRSLPSRDLNPFDITPETARSLHGEVFPYWATRNFREHVRARYDNPLGQQIDERFAAFFVWKTIGISHAIPDYPRLLRFGASGIREEVQEELSRRTAPRERAALEGMLFALDGLCAYAAALALEATRQSRVTADPTRRRELERIAAACERVPEHPARTLDDALHTVWIPWVALHMENTNTGLSLGRLDQWLQPYFAADMQACRTADERQACVAHAIELLGCLYLRCADHMPLIPDLGNHLFGGSSSDQAITLGGLTAEGGDAVNDMTYLLLKVTELLAVRDPNVNARYHPEVHSEAYLRRLCEVNLVTTATPSLHNDAAVLAALEPLGYPLEAARDWSATGCVEPSLPGQHMAHTGSILLNLVAPLEMALNDGRHPLMRWQLGPHTGRAADFDDFEAFFSAFSVQLAFLVEQAVEYNNLLAGAHAELRPTPLLSALLAGCIESARDLTRGGVRYNSSGVACIGLADVTDSLLVIREVVFERRDVSFQELKQAVDADFVGHAALHARVSRKIDRFGSGSPVALAMANRLARLIHDLLIGHDNYRGGPYVAGFWSMSNHVAFGTLTGALPSGRLAGKAFTPGLTPAPGASKSLLDNLRDVAGLDPTAIGNNMAFNVKVAPGGDDTHAAVVDRMRAYAHAFFGLGGMQMQLNAVTSETLRDAMAHPEAYRDLLVRISGYNAYFVTLSRDLQVELVERSEFGLA